MPPLSWEQMTTVVPTRRLLMVPEVADRLRVSVRTVRRLIETGDLPAVRLGRKGAAIRVDEAELEAFCTATRRGRSMTSGFRLREVRGAVGFLRGFLLSHLAAVRPNLPVSQNDNVFFDSESVTPPNRHFSPRSRKR
jgi:excisionase family DNA binding protein